MKYYRLQTVLTTVILTGMLVFAVGCQANRQESTQSSGAKNSVVERLVWSPDTDCSTCHTTECTTRNQAHQTLDCATCHSDSAALAIVHEGVNEDTGMPSKLKSTQVNEDSCLECHEDYGVLATKTSDSLVLTDDKGKSINPHEVKTLGSDGHETITCINCHLEHSENGAAETAATFCVSCHHENVYECGTCHE